MTAVFSFSARASFNESNELREYQVEVITFDGESEIVYVEAYDEYEAQEIAASMVADADYTMVQGVAWADSPVHNGGGYRKIAIFCVPSRPLLRCCQFLFVFSHPTTRL